MLKCNYLGCPMNEIAIVNKLIEKLQRQSAFQTYQALKLLATDIPLYIPQQQPDLIPAAVLVPIILHQHSASLLLTLRAKHLLAHAGQISFPGGKQEQHEDALECALRETQEEIGITKDQITIVSDLGHWPSYSGYLIKPYVGIIQSPVMPKASLEEVQEIFEVPIRIAFDSLLYQRVDKSAPFPYHYYELNFEQKNIWGFTAGLMLLLATYAK